MFDDVRDRTGVTRPEGFLQRVMEQFAFEYCDDLFWRVDDGVVNVFTNCSDTFAWGCADAEQITAENVDLLESTRLEAEALLGRYRAYAWPLLWCARVRGMRPQGAAYKHIDAALHPLFDAAGPPREAGFGNPVAR